MPINRVEHRHIGLVGVMGDWTTISARSLTDVPSLHAALEEHCERTPSDFAFIAPSTHLGDLHFRVLLCSLSLLLCHGRFPVPACCFLTHMPLQYRLRQLSYRLPSLASTMCCSLLAAPVQKGHPTC